MPSAIGEKGSAQNANEFISTMLDPDSQGFLAIFQKIEDPPDWIKGIRAGKPSSFDAAYNWLKTEQGKARLVEANRPPKWIKEARNNNEDWPTHFVEDYDKKVKEAEGVPTLIRKLRDKGLLPLARPYFATRIDGNTAAVSPWDRLAVRLAVAHLLSWESWVLNTAKEHQKRIDDMETFKRRIASEKNDSFIDSLRKYEVERLEELTANSQDLGDAPQSFKITKRMVRGWTDLRAKWLTHSNASEDELLVDVAKEQTAKRGKFGDPHLYRWLAKSKNREIWIDTNEDSLGDLACAFGRLPEAVSMSSV